MKGVCIYSVMLPRTEPFLCCLLHVPLAMVSFDLTPILFFYVSYDSLPDSNSLFASSQHGSVANG